MAAARIQKRRPVTYGKPGRIHAAAFETWNLSPQKAKSQEVNSFSQPLPSSVASVGRTHLKQRDNLGRPIAKRANEGSEDVFNVPTSDDEDYATPSTPKEDFKSSSPTTEGDAMSDLASSATSRDSDSASTGSGVLKRKRTPDSADVQLLREAAVAVQTRAVPSLPPSRKAVRATADAKQSKHSATRDVRNKVTSPKRSSKHPHPSHIDHHHTGNLDSHPNTARKPTKLRVIKGSSAPAQLEDMLLSSPSFHKLDKTYMPKTSIDSPKKARFDRKNSPCTPPPAPSANLDQGNYGSVTPRQTELFNKLIGDTPQRNSPSTLPVSNLRIGGKSKISLLLSSEVTEAKPAQRRRLIDTLAKDRQSVLDDEESLDETALIAEDPSETAHVLASSSQSMDIESSAPSQNWQGSRATYGTTRTYLEESALGQDLFLDIPFHDTKSAGPIRYGQSNMYSQASQGSSQIYDEMDEDQGTMKSIHELRAKGDNDRFIDDFYNLLHDIQYRGANPLSRQRLGIMELCKKLDDKKYIARMLDHGMDEQFLQACSGIKDIVFRCVLAAVISLIAHTSVPEAVMNNIYRSEAILGLFETLDDERDITAIGKDRQTNMSPISRSTLGEVRQLMIKQQFWEGEKPTIISPMILTLKALSKVLHNLRVLKPSAELLNEHHTAQLISALERNVAQTPPAYNTISMIVSSLETGSVTPGSTQIAWTPKRRSRFAAVVPRILLFRAPGADSIAMLCFQLIIDLTNNNAKSCEQFADEKFIKQLTLTIISKFECLSKCSELTEEGNTAEDKATVQILDYLILALGTINTIAEHCDAARAHLCTPDDAPVNALVDAFLVGRESAAAAKTVQATHLNIPYAWLAVALGNLCQNGNVRAAVGMRLPGKHLTTLVQAVEEFATYNRKLEEDMYGNSMEPVVGDNMTQRLSKVVEFLRHAT